MKRVFLFTILFFVATVNIYSQFSIEKFISEKLVIFNYNRYTKMTDMEKKVVPEKYESLPVKVEYLIPKEGGIMRQSVTSDTKEIKQIGKMFDLLFGYLSKKFNKTERDDTNGATRNVLWRGPDNTMYTLTKSATMAMLTMIKMM